MPKKKKNTYEVEGQTYKSFATAIARAADLSLERDGDDVNVVEHGQTGNYVITIRAQAEQIS